MNEYEINNDTIAIVPFGKDQTQIIEKNETFLINKNALEIIEDSCRYFGSSLLGRHEGTKSMIGISHKAPIVIEESREIIFFPTTSPRLEECKWISLRHIYNYNSIGHLTEILFANGKELQIDMSYGSFDNQVLRATRLAAVLRSRKNIEKVS